MGEPKQANQCTCLDTVDLDAVPPALICMYILVHDCVEQLRT